MRVLFRRWKCQMGYRARQRHYWRIVFPLVFLGLGLGFLTYVQTMVRPMIHTVALYQAKRVAVDVMEGAVRESQTVKTLEYSDFVQLDKKEGETVSTLTANTVRLNEIRSELMEKVTMAVQQLDEQYITIPLGSFSGIDLFAGLGYRVPVALKSFGYAQVDFESTFFESGINQTKHEINILLKTTVSALLPTGSVSADVTACVPVFQTIIVGDVPQSYTDIHGVGAAEDYIPNLLK